MGTTIARQSSRERGAATTPTARAALESPALDRATKLTDWVRKITNATPYPRFHRTVYAAAAGGGGKRPQAHRPPMTGDREQGMEACASDDIAKPGDSSQLLSLRCVWLH